MGQVSVTLGSANQATAKITNLNIGSIYADWDYKLKIWPHIPRGSGSVTGSVSGSYADVSVVADLDTSSPGHVSVKASSVSVSVGDLSIKFHGGLTSLLLNLFKDLFGGFIRSKLSDALSTSITAAINTNLNAALLALPTSKPLSKGANHWNQTSMEIGFTSWDGTTSYVSLGVEGYVQANLPNWSPPYTAPSLPVISPVADTSYVQVMLSAYTLESLAAASVSVDALSTLITHDKLPAGFPVQLNTSSTAFKLIAPGLAARYPNQLMAIKAYAAQGAVVSSAADDDSFAVSLPLRLEFDAATGGYLAPGFTLGCTLSTALKVGVKTGAVPAINGSLEYLSCPLTVTNSSVGAVNIGLLKDAVDILLSRVIMPLVNDLAGIGLPLPAVDGISLTNPGVHFENNYAVISTDVSVNISALPFVVPEQVKLQDGSVVQWNQHPALPDAATLARVHSEGQADLRDQLATLKTEYPQVAEYMLSAEPSAGLRGANAGA